MIHFDSPDGSAILPSIDSASLSVIRGRPSLSLVSQPVSERFAAGEQRAPWGALFQAWKTDVEAGLVG